MYMYGLLWQLMTESTRRTIGRSLGTSLVSDTLEVECHATSLGGLLAKNEEGRNVGAVSI